MDQHKLRSLVFEKTGVRVDIDDPIFALVALNEAVLAEAVERHVALIDAASQELVRHARNAGGIGAAGGASAPHADAAYIDATNEPLLAAAAARSAGAPSIEASAAVHAPTPALPVRAIATQSPLLTPREWRLLAVRLAGARRSGPVLHSQAGVHRAGSSEDADARAKRRHRQRRKIIARGAEARSQNARPNSGRAAKTLTTIRRGRPRLPRRDCCGNNSQLAETGNST